MTIVPQDLQYTDEHEWVRRSDIEPAHGGAAVVRVGITDHAQDALGDVVYVSLPAIGTQVRGGDALGEIESTKSVSELFAPVSGTVIGRNEALDASPEMLNSDPYGEGWIVDIEVDDDAEIEALLAPEAYAALITS